MENKYMTVKELQELLRIGPTAARTLLKSDGFPVIRVGKHIRIPTKEFDEWISNQNKGK